MAEVDWDAARERFQAIQRVLRTARGFWRATRGKSRTTKTQAQRELLAAVGAYEEVVAERFDHGQGRA
jgi:hypothetical protein